MSDLVRFGVAMDRALLKQFDDRIAARGYENRSEALRDLYQYWRPGMEPAVFEETAPEEVAAASGDGGGAVESAYTKLVPAQLVERSRAALEKWRATH